ncbi:hypothetical protein J1N35_011773 [Gossypium stocksii]|uniref:Uncharacterized protein n=1 Tax=Gossypium stocksii TaxID=47602 RepID=A0A9D3W4N4_9ROSI|nr:hypothetical protein J1N35_011773 [Gossypium stocksii]
MDKLKKSMKDAKESYDMLGEYIESRDFVIMALTSNRDSVQELLNSHKKKMKERINAPEAMVIALKKEIIATTKALNTKIDELERELALCRVVMKNGVSSAVLNYEDVSKPKEFSGDKVYM